MPDLLEQVVDIAHQAGEAIMHIYNSEEHGVEYKEDDSPLTRADKAANKIIIEKLKKISDHPIISEENEQREGDDIFWLVDPLDGTKEFIKKNGEFTVNIALIMNGEPVMGVVYAPDKDMLYAADNSGAYKVKNGAKKPIKAEFNDEVPVVVASRSHIDERTEKLLKSIGKHQVKSMGSSLKLCLVAEGEAMLYPRLAPTYLWDTAAAHAVVRAAGGQVLNIDGQPLEYHPEKNMKNPYFVACTSNSLDWQQYLKA